MNKEIAIITDVKTNCLIHRFSSWKNARECKKTTKQQQKHPNIVESIAKWAAKTGPEKSSRN